MPRPRLLSAISVPLSALFALTSPSPAQAPPPGTTREITQEQADAERAKHEKVFADAFAGKDYPAAEAALRELIPLDADNFVPWYNLACVLSLQGKSAEAATMLKQAIARGFADFNRLTTDPDLSAVRGTEDYQAILQGWDRILDRRIDQNLEAVRQRFGGISAKSPYAFEKDQDLRLAYVAAFDPVLFGEAKQEITRMTRFWERSVLPEAEPLRSGTPVGQKPKPAPWVIVILPTRPDYRTWAVQRFGDMWDRIGGQYSHDHKQLVAQDLGSTLRHEYWHALHWRHMDQLGQRHPHWVMEGLCSLVEDVEGVPAGIDGAFVALPSWRTNIARRLAKAGRLMPWDVLFGLDRTKFVTVRPLATYAQSRAIFMFLLDRGKLREWYTAYVAGYNDDQTGRAAFEAVFAKPLKEIEKDYRAWLLTLPEVVETLGAGPCDLPFEVDGLASQGDGVPITAGPIPPAARKAGLRPRDVITGVNGTPVRDASDLARILGAFQPGQPVEIAYRRGAEHGVASVTLVQPKD